MHLKCGIFHNQSVLQHFIIILFNKQQATVVIIKLSSVYHSNIFIYNSTNNHKYKAQYIKKDIYITKLQ